MPVLVACLVVLVGCTRPVPRAYLGGTTAGQAQAPAPIAITGAGFDLQAAGSVSQATTDSAWAGVLATLNGYLAAAVLTPLATGGPAGDLVPLFTSPAAGRVSAGPDRAAFIDEGLPPAADIRADTAVATLTALAGTDGTVSVVSASIDLRLHAMARGLPLTVVRTGDLVLLPEGGTWRIDGYDVKASRTLDATSTTVGAHS